MSPKLTQGRKLSTLTALCLLLVAVIAENNENTSEVKPFVEYDLSLEKDNSLLRTNLPYADRSIVVTKDMWGPLGPRGFWIKLISSEPNSTTKECFQPSKPASMRTVKRLSYDSVLFDALPINKQSERKLVWLNLKNCSYKVVYDGLIPLDYKIFPSSNASDESFALIMNGKMYCRGYNWCRLYFNPFYHKFEPLNFDFPSTGFYNINPATSYDGNFFVVDLLDDTDNTYVKRLYNVTDNNSTRSEFKQLLSIPNYVSLSLGWPQIELVSSSPLSYCWRTSRDTKEDKTVHCAAFREDGSLVINQTLFYSDVIKIYKVQSIPNGLILIGKRDNCGNEVMCSDLQSTAISKDSNTITVRNSNYDFKCRSSFVSRMYIRVNVSSDTVELYYMCIYEKHADYTHTYVESE